MTNIIKKWENPTFLQNGEKLKNKLLPHFVRNCDFFFTFCGMISFMILFFSGYFLMSSDPVSGRVGRMGFNPLGIWDFSQPKFQSDCQKH